jgi:hypothetical protein
MELHLAESVSVFNGEEFCKKVPFSELSRLARDVRSKWMSSTLHPEDKMLLRIKIRKWNKFQEQFSLPLWHREKLLFLAKAPPRQHSCGQI